MRVSSVIAGLVLAASCAAAQSSIKAYTDRSTVVKGERFGFIVEIQGREIGELVIPQVEGIETSTVPVQTQQSFRMEVSGIKAITIRTCQYKYVFRATQTGKITIPPVTAEIDGVTVAGNPVVLTVVERTQGAPTPPQPSQRNYPQRRGITWEDVAFIESAVDRQQVFEGEPVLLTLSFYRLVDPRIQVNLESKLLFPAAEGFYATPLEGQQQDQRQRNGLNYHVTIFQEVLYPTRPGELTIAPWEIDVVAGSGFDFERLSLKSGAININVLPLPDRPPNFSGAVGDFVLTAKPGDDEVIQGTPLKFTVEITGRGNPDSVGAPVLRKIENAHVSDPETEVEPAPRLAPLGITKRFSYTIVPLEPGPLEIPVIEFIHFDPSVKEYRTQRVGPFRVEVLRSSESTSRVLFTKATAPEEGHVDVVGEDILPPQTDPGRLRPFRVPQGVVPGVAVTPAVGYAVLALFMRRQRRLAEDPRYAREYFARSKTEKRLKRLLQSPEPTEELYRAVTEFIADKLDVPAGGMTSLDARHALESRGISNELIDTVVRVLRACERARYASVAVSKDEVAALVDAAGSAIAGLEGELKKRPAAGRNNA